MAALQAPASLTAQYLYHGAYFFSNSAGATLHDEGCPECLLGLGRLVYSTGAAVVAPLGILYHIAAAAKNALQSCCTDIDDESEELSTRAWQHIDAMGYDFLGFCSVLVTAIVALGIILTFVYGDLGFLRALLPLILGALVTQDNPFKITLFAYMVEGEFFMHLLSDEKGAGGSLSQQDRYMTQLGYNRLSATGVYIDQPLTLDEMQEFLKITNAEASTVSIIVDQKIVQAPLPKLIDNMFSIPKWLREQGRVAPAYTQRIDQRLAKEKLVKDAYTRVAQRAANMPFAERQKSAEELDQEFFAEVARILNAAPLPAAPGGPATA